MKSLIHLVLTSFFFFQMSIQAHSEPCADIFEPDFDDLVDNDLQERIQKEMNDFRDKMFILNGAQPVSARELARLRRDYQRYSGRDIFTRNSPGYPLVNDSGINLGSTSRGVNLVNYVNRGGRLLFSPDRGYISRGGRLIIDGFDEAMIARQELLAVGGGSTLAGLQYLSYAGKARLAALGITGGVALAGTAAATSCGTAAYGGYNMYRQSPGGGYDPGRSWPGTYWEAFQDLYLGGRNN